MSEGLNKGFFNSGVTAVGAVNFFLNFFLNWNHILSVAVTTGLPVRPEGSEFSGPVSKTDRENGEQDCDSS